MQTQFSLGDGPKQSPYRDKTTGGGEVEDDIGSSRLGCYIFKKLVPFCIFLSTNYYCQGLVIFLTWEDVYVLQGLSCLGEPDGLVSAEIVHTVG